MSASTDPAFPAPADLIRLLYWGDVDGERPADHVRYWLPGGETDRHILSFILSNGRDAHPGVSAKGWANCRLCGAQLGVGDLTAFGFVWPEKAEHYVLEHKVWTPACSQLLQRVREARRR